jgi:hypothetical protein
MGGKALKFPKRKKFVASEKKHQYEQAKEITPQEHEKRLQVLRDMGLIK